VKQGLIPQQTAVSSMQALCSKLKTHWTNIAHHLYLKAEAPVPLPAVGPLAELLNVSCQTTETAILLVVLLHPHAFQICLVLKQLYGSTFAPTSHVHALRLALSVFAGNQGRLSGDQHTSSSWQPYSSRHFYCA
jgi:hypothetical protein